MVLCAGLSLATATSASAQPVRVKDIARVQGVTNNQLVGYGIVTGLNGTGDSTQVIFTSQTIQNILQSFGLNTNIQAVRTRNVAAVTPLPISTPADAPTAARTRCTCFASVGFPVPLPLTISAWARPRLIVSSTSASNSIAASGAECFTSTSARILMPSAPSRRPRKDSSAWPK